MKKISKAVALILTLALMLTILAACGGGTTTQSRLPRPAHPRPEHRKAVRPAARRRIRSPFSGPSPRPPEVWMRSGICTSAT